MRQNNRIKAMRMLDENTSHWRVELNPDEAIEFAIASGDVNLLNVIQQVNQIIPVIDFGSANPNTGRTVHTYSIGREYHRCVYVGMVQSYFLNREDVDFQQIENKICQIGREWAAEEVDACPHNLQTIVRICWT